MAKFKIKAASFDAYLWTGVYDEKTTPRWFIQAMKKKGDEEGAARIISNDIIKTVTDRQILTAQKGDYVVRDTSGKLFPVKSAVLKLLNVELVE